MATNNLVRTLSFTLLVSLSAPAFSAQEQPRVVESANDATVSPLPDTKVQTVTELPLSPPIVVCNGQELTITANNSTLGSVLAEVRKCTGAQIEIPEGMSANRLFDHLGPGPARQVLTALLAETGYDFVIGSSDHNPDKVESVLLMVRGKDTSDPAVDDRNLTPTRRAFLQMRQNASPRSGTSEENTQGTEGASDASTNEQAAVAPAESTPTNANPTPASDPSSVAGPGAPSAPTPASDPSSVAAPGAPSAPTPAGDLSSVAALGAPSAPNSTPPAAGPNPGSPQSSPTEDQITNMQQLFQQRQKMMQNQNQNPPQAQ